MLACSVKRLAFLVLGLQIHHGRAAQPFRTSLTLMDFREQVRRLPGFARSLHDGY